MTEFVVALAGQARRTALLAALHRHPALTVDQLHHLVHDSEYAEELAELTVNELLDPGLRRPPLPVRPGESIADAMMRVFRGQPDTWFSSGFFTTNMGLRRWTAQGTLAELAERGLLERTGVTSATRHRLVCGSGAPGARARLGPKE